MLGNRREQIKASLKIAFRQSKQQFIAANQSKNSGMAQQAVNLNIRFNWGKNYHNAFMISKR